MKRFLTVFLVISMLLSTTACAAEPEKMRSTEPQAPQISAANEESAANGVYIDVSADADYADAVAWCREQGLMAGVGNGRFDPDGTLTRAMLVTVLHRAAGAPVVNYQMSFQDVAPETWYTEAVRWAASEKLVHGYSSSAFGSNDPVSVEQLQVILDRYLGKGNTWKGDPDKAEPATRAQVAIALYEALNTEVETVGKVLVAYFSCTNNTKGVAEIIAASVDNADLYEITPTVPYTSADLDYNTDCRANREQNDFNARPEISGSVKNWENYDVVFLGYPIWWGNAPKIIYTFLERYDFSGKTVIPFCTSGSSPYNDSTIKSLVGNDTTWISGQRFSGNDSQSAVQSWVESLGLDQKEETIVDKLDVTFNGHTYTATLAKSNSTVEAFVQAIKDNGGSITISAHDYGGWEKVGDLGEYLGTADNVQTHTVPGDFVLYSGNQIVLFYGSNDWSYTLLGHLDGDLSNLKSNLGNGNVNITFSINQEG